MPRTRSGQQANNRGAYAPKWTPNTAYSAGDIVQAPEGGVVRRLTSGTSGTSFSTTNWEAANFPLGLRSQSDTVAPITITSVAKPGGASPGLINWKHDDPTPAVDLFHLTAGNTMVGNIIAIGMDGPGGKAIFINNKVGGKGLYIVQNDTITDPAAYGFYGVSGSHIAPLIRLESTGSAAMPMLSMLSAGEARMAEFYLAGNALAGFIDGTDGRLRWAKDVTVEAGSPFVRTLGTVNGQRGDFQPEGITGRAYSGSAGLHYPFRILSNVSSDGVTRIQTSAATAVGSETWRNVMGWATVSSTARLGFFGVTPVVQQGSTPAAATDLATALTLVNALRTGLLNFGLFA